jgi:ubiquinone/menaquinone biosynthesis C-methylase UbiE
MTKNVQSAYNNWAQSYDAIENKTRDLDKQATMLMLADVINSDSIILEFGCGTGKNTEWLIKNSKKVIAVDFSQEMLNKAVQKFSDNSVIFQQADINQPWPFENHVYDLVTCNLILEHVQNLNPVFSEAARVLKPNGYFFVSELHPFKQYQGSKARFETNNKIVSPDCFTHHISDFFNAAQIAGLQCTELKEWFDNHNRDGSPRLISFLFKKTVERI